MLSEAKNLHLLFSALQILRFAQDDSPFHFHGNEVNYTTRILRQMRIRRVWGIVCSGFNITNSPSRKLL